MDYNGVISSSDNYLDKDDLVDKLSSFYNYENTNI